VNKLNTILGQLLALGSISRFEKLVREHKSERQSKWPRSWTQIVAMLFGRLSGQHGLRSIETGMNSQRNSLYHLGIDENTEVKRSTASYANGKRSAGCIRACLRRRWKRRDRTARAAGLDLRIPCIALTRRLLTSA
jgi:hypothetical protein